MARKLAYGVAALAVSFCSAAFGLGLGGIESRSSLNEPLTARIALHAVEPGELEQVQVRLASSEAFARAGIERPFHLSRLDFEVDVEAGEPVIRVASAEAITEPFLSFLIEVSWPRGQMVREYTLLLDPPVFADDRGPATTATADVGSSGAGVGAGEAAPSAAVASPRRVSTPAADSHDPLPAGENYVVQAGDSLWSVAERVRPDQSVGVQQAMLALLRSNPDAFINGDPDRLRRGAVLQVPERQAMIGTSNINAAYEIERLVAARGPDSTRIAAADVEPEPTVGADAPSAAEAAGNDGRLQVVAAADSGDGLNPGADLEGDLPVTEQSIRALQNELSLVTESNVGLEAENADLRAQTAAMREELRALQELVTLQAVQADAQRTIGAEPDSVVSETETAEAGSGQLEDAGADVAETEAADTEAVAEEAADTAAVVPAVLSSEPEATAEPSWMDLARDPRVAGAVGGTVLVIGLWALLVGRRRRLARAVPVTIQIHDNGEQPTTDEPAEDTADAMADLDSGRDPLAEADAFLAYGRYDQAQSTVLDALEAEPERVELRIKLLEVFVLTENRIGFEEHAEILHKQVDGTGPEWDRAVEMGREIAPEHPFFSSMDEYVAPAAEEGEVVLTGDEETLTFGEQPTDDVSDEPREDGASDDSYLDFSLDFDTEPAGDASADGHAGAQPDDDTALNFEVDFASDDQPLSEAAATEPEFAREQADEAAEPSADLDLDFDLEGMLEQTESQSADAASNGATEADASDLDTALDFSLDGLELEAEPLSTSEAGPELDDFDAPVDPEQEVGTKLDLARAYLEMGDDEGARELLSEVIEEGSDAQKQTASEMLKKAS